MQKVSFMRIVPLLLWKSLPLPIRSCSSLATFKKQLKTFLFRKGSILVYKHQCSFKRYINSLLLLLLLVLLLLLLLILLLILLLLLVSLLLLLS